MIVTIRVPSSSFFKITEMHCIARILCGGIPRAGWV